LISVDFLASKYCYEIEMSRALERHRQGSARVIPIILRPVAWYTTPLQELQVLPRDARPVTTWPSVDLAFQDICQGILDAVIAWRLRTAVRVSDLALIDPRPGGPKDATDKKASSGSRCRLPFAGSDRSDRAYGGHGTTVGLRRVARGSTNRHHVWRGTGGRKIYVGISTDFSN
jgi:hypothetical protein